MENSDAEVKLLLASAPWLLAAALLNPQGGWAQQPCLALPHVDREVFISCISQADSRRVRQQRCCSAVQQAGEFMWSRAGEAILHRGCPWRSWGQRDVLTSRMGWGLGSGDGLLLSRWGELSLPGTPMPRVHDALQMLPPLLTKAEIDTINKQFVKFFSEGKKTPL